MHDSEDILRTAEVIPKIDNLLPPGYPKYVFHGTSVDNLSQVARFGLGNTGTCTSSFFDTTDPRYSREDGCTIVCPHTSSDFLNTGPEGIMRNHYYTVNATQEEKIKYSFNHRDPDGIAYEDKTHETDTYIIPDRVSAFRVNPEQQVYLALIADLLSGSSEYNYVREVSPGTIDIIEKLIVSRGLTLADGADPVSQLYTKGVIKEEREVIDWNVYQNQKYAARCLGLDPSDFRTIESLRTALAPHCTDEASFVDFALRNFPGEVEWVLKNYEIGDSELLGQIVVQAHQLDIVARTEALLDGDQVDFQPLFPESNNMQKFNELQKSRVKPLVVKEVEAELEPEEPEIVLPANQDQGFILD